MAKAKKTAGAGEPAPTSEPVARKAATGKGGAARKAPAARKTAKSEKAPAGGPPQAPPIDTGLAAQAAASMIANRAVAGLGSAPPGGASAQQTDAAAGARPESSTFKNLKEGLSKPPVGGLGGILGAGGGRHKQLNQGFGGPKPSVPGGGGRNQTFGADVNRTGVPRRTGG